MHLTYYYSQLWSNKTINKTTNVSIGECSGYIQYSFPHHNNMNDSTFLHIHPPLVRICACAGGQSLVGTLCAVQWCMVTPLEDPPENSDRKILMLLGDKRSDCFLSRHFKETLKSVKTSNGASHLKRKDARARTLNIVTLPVGCDSTTRLTWGRGVGGLSGQSTFTLRTIVVFLTISTYVHAGKLIYVSSSKFSSLSCVSKSSTLPDSMLMMPKRVVYVGSSLSFET